ncbi:hypothetical protein [Nonomuraea sp. KM90]|uniref:hypothetical protein n=1 Tax=Nonomuraea sp. KM90 TaxID=3457428 RepID=UPI003FCE01DD
MSTRRRKPSAPTRPILAASRAIALRDAILPLREQHPACVRHLATTIGQTLRDAESAFPDPLHDSIPRAGHAAVAIVNAIDNWTRNSHDSPWDQTQRDTTVMSDAIRKETSTWIT